MATAHPIAARDLDPPLPVVSVTLLPFPDGALPPQIPKRHQAGSFLSRSSIALAGRGLEK